MPPDDFDDLIRAQEQFLASSMKPSARVIRRGNERGNNNNKTNSISSPNPKHNPNNSDDGASASKPKKVSKFKQRRMEEEEAKKRNGGGATDLSKTPLSLGGFTSKGVVEKVRGGGSSLLKG